MPDVNHPSRVARRKLWSLWLLSAALIVAAVIDGWKLRVPNWITFPLICQRLGLQHWYFGWEGLAGACWAPLSAWGFCCPPTPSAGWAPAM